MYPDVSEQTPVCGLRCLKCSSGRTGDCETANFSCVHIRVCQLMNSGGTNKRTKSRQHEGESYSGEIIRKGGNLLTPSFIRDQQGLILGQDFFIFALGITLVVISRNHWGIEPLRVTEQATLGESAVWLLSRSAAFLGNTSKPGALITLLPRRRS